MTQNDPWARAFAAPPGTEAAPLQVPDTVRSHRRHHHTNRRTGTRADIQGLRMVAVVAVVVNHLTNHPRGGFVGVDVFFVISGYLITGRLLSMLGTRNAATYLWDFYKLRIRRILPAALVTIGLTIVLAQVVLNAARAHQTSVDGGWAAAFWANWHLVDASTNYFAVNGPQSPLQHYWSLAVEEQFYLAWPIGLLVIGWIVSRFARRSERQTTIRLVAGTTAALVLSAASLAWAFEQSSSNPTTAYFSTFTRGWELGVGALLACVSPWLPSLARPVATSVSWLGLAMIGVSLFTVHGGPGFPAPGALLPVAGSALVIAAGIRESHPSNVLLTNRAAVFVGDISYSVYLVHFPVIVLLAAEMPHKGPYFYATALLLMFGAAVVSWALVEEPVRHSGFLRPSDDRGRRPAHNGRPLRIALVGAAAAMLAVGTYALWPGDQAAQDSKYAQIGQALASTPPANPANPGTPADPTVTALQTELRQALRESSWPRLSPSFDSVLTRLREPAELAACGRTAPVSRSTCTWGSAGAHHEIVIAGDSISIAYAPALIAIVRTLPDWKLRVLGAYGCSFTDRPFLTVAQGLPAGCRAHNADVVHELQVTRPAVLVVANVGPSAASAVSTAAEINKAKGDVGKVVLLSSPPRATDPKTCFTPSSVPADCVSKLDNRYEIAALQHAAVLTSGVAVDGSDWFCASGLCPADSAGIPIRFDERHITGAYAEHIAPALEVALRKAVGVGS